VRDQKRLSRLARSRRETNGMRPRSTPSPSRESSAGRTVSEATIATATTDIVPTENDMKVASPLKSIPAIAISTVAPEMRIVRPDVAAAIAIASFAVRPAARSSRRRLR
jgi:hypothetical protein